MHDDTSAATALTEKLSRCTRIADPMCGWATPDTIARDSKLWPGAEWERVEATATSAGEGRRVEEYRYVAADGTTLPVVAIFDGSEARLYSAHELVTARAPLLPIDEQALHSPGGSDFLASYFHCLETADVDGALAAFEEDGYMQHSNGERFQGRERLRQDYEGMFKANGGKIQVKLANVLDDGRHRVFECLMPSGRPAVAIYERGPTNRIQAIRISL